MMMTQARLKWANGSKFTMNCYRHFSLLCLHGLGQVAVLLSSHECVTQGDVLMMILYSIMAVALIKEVKQDVLGALVHAYANNMAPLGKSGMNAKVMHSLICRRGKGVWLLS